MIETVLLCSVLGACLYAYIVGVRHGKAEVESASLKKMADSVRRAKRAADDVVNDSSLAQRVRERFTRK
jgi:hypothetical protein